MPPAPKQSGPPLGGPLFDCPEKTAENGGAKLLDKNIKTV